MDTNIVIKNDSINFKTVETAAETLARILIQQVMSKRVNSNQLVGIKHKYGTAN